jgi:hypothetical protein
VHRENEGDKPLSDGSGNELQLDVDRRGTEVVMQIEREQGRTPRKMDHFNEGYDVESLNDAGTIVRYIEIKSLSGGWDLSNVKLSASQFQKARDEGPRFWLYVVDRLESGKPGLYMIQDPASKVVEYQFDDGWAQAAESATARVRRSLLAARPPVRNVAAAGSETAAEDQD